MASSRRPGPVSYSYHDGIVPARTPGPLGVNDHADPDARAYLGNTPGPSGVNDGADPALHRPTRRERDFSVILLDRTRVARFLRSVAYVEATAAMIHAQKKMIGLWFSSTDLETGDERVKERLVHEKTAGLMQQFAEASSHGSRAALGFLNAQERLRGQAVATIQQAVSMASQSNQSTIKSLERWEAGLKTVEYGSSMVITVAGLFVSAPAALAAGIIGFSYNTATTVIDDHNKARTVDANVLALTSADVAKESRKSAGKEKAKDLLSGKDLEAIEELEAKVAHLHEKIAVKQAMIQETSSQHNIARLSRSIGKNEAELGSKARMIGRFRAVTFLFAAWDLVEKGKKIREAWHSE